MSLPRIGIRTAARIPTDQADETDSRRPSTSPPTPASLSQPELQAHRSAANIDPGQQAAPAGLLPLHTRHPGLPTRTHRDRRIKGRQAPHTQALLRLTRRHADAPFATLRDGISQQPPTPFAPSPTSQEHRGEHRDTPSFTKPLPAALLPAVLPLPHPGRTRPHALHAKRGPAGPKPAAAGTRGCGREPRSRAHRSTATESTPRKRVAARNGQQRAGRVDSRDAAATAPRTDPMAWAREPPTPALARSPPLKTPRSAEWTRPAGWSGCTHPRTTPSAQAAAEPPAVLDSTVRDGRLAQILLDERVPGTDRFTAR